MSIFDNVTVGPPVEVAALIKAFNEDTFRNKVNLSMGVYRTNESKEWVLPVVRKVEKILADDETRTKDYLIALGLEEFTKACTSMLLGKNSIAIVENRAFGVQCLSGTGSLRVGAEFCARILDRKIFYYSSPAWDNHHLVFQNAGFDEGRQYRYWSYSTNSIDFEGLVEDLSNAPKNSVIILQACAHNPTGMDPTHEQWEQIADVIEEKGLLPFFDSAYQGFASGDLEKDSWAVRYFVKRGFELFVHNRLQKILDERVGNLVCVLKSAEHSVAVKTQFTLLIRGMYSNPPCHGASIVAYVLNTPELYNEWKKQICAMSQRICNMRRVLRNALEQIGASGDWSHITKQIGMFSYLGINEQQVEQLIKKHHIYLCKSGRISMSGITTSNVDYVAQAIKKTMDNVK